MMWLPQQTRADWCESVDALIQVSPEHASLYLLELYPNAPLKEDMPAPAGHWPLTTMRRKCICGVWSTRWRRLSAVRDLERGSSRVRVAPQSQILGRRRVAWAGLWAHSTRTGVRWKNVSSTEEYISRLQNGQSVIAEQRVLSRESRLEEALFTGLRLTAGLDLDSVGRNTKRTSGRVMATRFNPHSPQVCRARRNPLATLA